MGGRFQPEWVATFTRTGGRFAPESTQRYHFPINKNTDIFKNIKNRHETSLQNVRIFIGTLLYFIIKVLICQLFVSDFLQIDFRGSSTSGLPEVMRLKSRLLYQLS